MEERLINQISFDIRQILPSVGEHISPEELTQNVNVNQFIEKADEINQLNLGNTGKLKENLSSVLGVDNNDLKGIGFASIAGIHTYNGNYKKALAGLNNALNIKVSNDVYAYILTEYANLLRLLKRTDESLAIFNEASNLTKNEKLKWRINTYIGYTFQYLDSDKALSILNNSADYYLKNKMYSRYATVLRHIGVIYSQVDDYKTANNYYSTAKIIAEEYALNSVIIALQIDIGWLYIKEKKYTEARNCYLQLLSSDLLPYDKSLSYQNMGVLEFESENYNKSIKYHKKSLQITLKYEMNEMLFEDYYKIGLSYENLGDYKNTEKYYKNGYAQLQDERKQLGLILLTGYRKNLLDNYIRFLSEKPSVEHVAQRDITFQFTLGKTYREMLDIFQENLLLLHRKRNKTIEQLCNSIDISIRLYFVYRNRFNLSKDSKKDIQQLNPHLKHYLFSLLSMNWRSAKIQFDNDLYRYLLRNNCYNKTKIAKLLDVSNLTVIKKTAKLY